MKLKTLWKKIKDYLLEALPLDGVPANGEDKSKVEPAKPTPIETAKTTKPVDEAKLKAKRTRKTKKPKANENK